MLFSPRLHVGRWEAHVMSRPLTQEARFTAYSQATLHLGCPFVNVFNQTLVSVLIFNSKSALQI